MTAGALPKKGIPKDTAKKLSSGEVLYQASQWKLMFWKLRRHKMAISGGIVLVVFYLMAIFAPIIAPYNGDHRSEYLFLAPQSIHWLNAGNFGPYVYGIEKSRNPDTLALEFEEKKDEIIPLHLFVRGDKYKLWGFIPMDFHLYGAEGENQVFIFGSDNLGRDLFSRSVLAAMISLSIGLVGVMISFILGVVIGGISGFFGGQVDTVIQHVILFLISMPQIPIWMGLSAAIPGNWPPGKTYFALTVVLSIIGWTGLARVVRGRILQVREETFVTAARLSGASSASIIQKHLIPATASYLIVNITLAVPGMILGETTLSFLGLGLAEPVISWGVLLQSAQNVRTIVLSPWLLIPGAFVILTTLAFSFLGDGLRDAADPYA
jgi:peptide/nickel transport system permease protein